MRAFWLFGFAFTKPMRIDGYEVLPVFSNKEEASEAGCDDYVFCPTGYGLWSGPNDPPRQMREWLETGLTFSQQQRVAIRECEAIHRNEIRDHMPARFRANTGRNRHGVLFSEDWYSPTRELLVCKL